MTEAKALETAEEISDIAFGFMGSKALFSALHVDLFSVLSEKPCHPQKFPRIATLMSTGQRPS